MHFVWDTVVVYTIIILHTRSLSESINYTWHNEFSNVRFIRKFLHTMHNHLFLNINISGDLTTNLYAKNYEQNKRFGDGGVTSQLKTSYHN